MSKCHPAYYLDILDNLYDGVYYVNRERQITFWNRAAERLTGYRQEDILGRWCGDNLLRHIDDQGVCLCLATCPLAQTLEDGQSRKAEVYLHHKDGHRLPVSVRISPIRDHTGLIVGAVEIFSDNSEGLAALQRLKELEHLAYLDPLTGLANRRYLEIFLEARFNEFQRYGWPFGLIYADVDHFKGVNDAYGHDVGDQVLKMVAKTLSQNCRSFDLVGRWGGEEFLCVIAHLTKTRRLGLTAERLRKLVEHSWVSLNGATLKVTVSMGAAMIRPGDTLELMIQRADQLLSQGKAGGRNRVMVG